MKIDRYTTYARIIPAILATGPILLLLNYHMPDVSGLEGFWDALATPLKLSPGILFIYPIMRAAQFVGKTIEEWLFGDKLHFPTTDLLLHSSHKFSTTAKERISDILNTAGYMLATPIEEQTNELEARKRVVEAMAFIRLKVGNGTHTLEYNIGYGFWRNFVGASLIAFILSVAELLYTLHDKQFLPLEQVAALAVIYGAILLFSKFLIRRSACRYATVLLDEFRSLFV